MKVPPACPLLIPFEMPKDWRAALRERMDVLRIFKGPTETGANTEGEGSTSLVLQANSAPVARLARQEPTSSADDMIDRAHPHVRQVITLHVDRSG